jgi:hypothetical protein
VAAARIGQRDHVTRSRRCRHRCHCLAHCKLQRERESDGLVECDHKNYITRR